MKGRNNEGAKGGKHPYSAIGTGPEAAMPTPRNFKGKLTIYENGHDQAFTVVSEDEIEQLLQKTHLGEARQYLVKHSEWEDLFDRSWKPLGLTKRITYFPPEEAIRERAYALFLARGCVHGHDREDWLQAERELTQTVTVILNSK